MFEQAHYKVGCDAHKRYSVFAVCDGKGKVLDRVRVNHERGAIQGFLSQFPSGTPVALETVGNWYWIVDEIEVAGCVALLAHAGKAKAMMGHTHKTDKLDAEGLATLLHNGTLPTVWIPPGDLRDERELPRTRMALSKVRTMLKNRMHSTWPSMPFLWTPRVTSSPGSGGRSSWTCYGVCPERLNAACSRSSSCWTKCRSRSIAWKLASWSGCRRPRPSS